MHSLIVAISIMLLSFQETADHKDETRVGGRGSMLGSWPQRQESLPQQDRLVANWPYLEHSVRLPSFSLPSFLPSTIITLRDKKGGDSGEILHNFHIYKILVLVTMRLVADLYFALF